jgi:hypothetical protein
MQLAAEVTPDPVGDSKTALEVVVQRQVELALSELTDEAIVVVPQAVDSFLVRHKSTIGKITVSISIICLVVLEVWRLIKP